jgi:hypothetical protein
MEGIERNLSILLQASVTFYPNPDLVGPGWMMIWMRPPSSLERSWPGGGRWR